MNARVLLLILVSGLFMAAWDGDQAVMQAAIARKAEARRAAVASSDLPANQPSDAHQRFAARPVRATASQLVTAGLAEDQIPRNIPAGSYRAVSQSGETHQIHVDGRLPKQSGHREFYIVDARDGERWYLIRLQ